MPDFFFPLTEFEAVRIYNNLPYFTIFTIPEIRSCPISEDGRIWLINHNGNTLSKSRISIFEAGTKQKSEGHQPKSKNIAKFATLLRGMAHAGIADISNAVRAMLRSYGNGEMSEATANLPQKKGSVW